MTKLEEKLKELGYELFYITNLYQYGKRFNMGYITILTDTENKQIIRSFIAPIAITNQRNIDSLQQAFNEMQKDLEELRKYEIRD